MPGDKMNGHLDGLGQTLALTFALPTVEYAYDLPPAPTRSGSIASATVTEAGSDVSLVTDYDYDALGRALEFTYDAYGSLPTGAGQYYYGTRLYERPRRVRLPSSSACRPPTSPRSSCGGVARRNS